MTALRFALRGLRRDWRSGDLRLLAIALTLCVAAITAVGFFTERVEKALQRQGNLLLAADLVVESPEPLPTEFADHARSSGLETAQTLSFPSVVMGSGSPQLVQVKAVDAHYPLRGDLLLQDAVGGPTAAADGAPPGGRIWVEPRLVALLGAALGERVELGAVRFELERLVALEPDRGGNLFQLAPRVMMNRDDIPATGLVSPASRVQHRLLVAGTSAAVERFESWIRPRLPNTARVLTSADARPEFRAALEKGGRFLALASLICVLVAGAAIALSSRRLVERQASAVAIMRCLGASSRFLRNELSARLGLLLAVTTLLGSAAGFLAQWVLAALVGQWFSHDLPATGALPLLSGRRSATARRRRPRCRCSPGPPPRS